MMTSRPVPVHLRNPNHPPRNLPKKSRAHWVRNAHKELQNYFYQQDYPPFYIPLPCYQVIHLHRFTSMHTMKMVIDHFKCSRSFSIDTESDCHTRELALIQIHSIPIELPSMLIFVQLQHLPTRDTVLFEQITLFFQLTFQLGNTMYSWGPLIHELEKAPSYGLFSFPLGCRIVNLQKDFKDWIKRELPPCEVCPPVMDQSNSSINLYRRNCRCIPYMNINDTWSLQNAIRYSCNQFLDKSFTEFSWNILLDPVYSHLPSSTLQHQLRYASYDCLAVSYLHRPVSKKWTFRQFIETTISMLLTDELLMISPMDLQEKSDDELPWINSKSNILQQQSNDDELLIAIPETDSLPELPALPGPALSNSSQVKKKSHARRSLNARTRRNKKRNYTHRSNRYRYCVIRALYYRFTMASVRQILHQMNIKFVHVKPDKNCLLIGVKDGKLRDQVQNALPLDIFDREHYYRR